jgi:nicotinamidase-related amidase
MKLINDNGIKTAVINMFVDPENGFSKSYIDDGNGGNLYVPNGEEVIPFMGDMVEKSRGAIFVIGQDYHPRTHISFMVNHPGVMAYREERAEQSAGFPEIVLDEDRNIFGLKETDGRIRQVQVETSSGHSPSERDRGRVTKVLDVYHHGTFNGYRAEGRLLSTQVLWPMHCVQGTESSLYPDDLKLPAGLRDKLAGDLMSRTIYHRDPSTDNEFWIVRKGGDSEIDSYGIGVENDGNTLTEAWNIFSEIAGQLKAKGCQRVIINGGGLATNFCVEFSFNNIADFLAGHFKMRDMETQINFVPEISRGIPIPGDVNTPFSLAGVEHRLQRRGIGTTTVSDILAMTTSQSAPALKSSFPAPEPV